MLSSKCTHIRIRDDNDYDMDVDNFIKSIQKEYNIDFRTFPGWQELVQRLHVASTDCKRKIQAALLRKATIIDKLYIQSTRPSPFELTDGLCRTASKWRQIEMNAKKRKSTIPADVKSEELPEELLEEMSEAPHPNTENYSSNSIYPSSPRPEEPLKVNAAVQVDSRFNSTHLPAVVVTNPHKFISPIGSKYGGISYKSVFSNTDRSISGTDKEVWQYLKPTSSVICTPMPIILTDNSLKQQTVRFSVTNCSGQYMHIRFKFVLDDSHFLKTKLMPVIPKRLYPGIPVVFKFIFTLKSQEEFKASLYFKVARDVYDDAPPESFSVPINSAFTIARSVAVSETINIPPIYPWHLKRNDMFPSAMVQISVNDPYTYHLHIYKLLIDLSNESNIMLSLQATGPDTESFVERIEDKQVDAKTIVSSVMETDSLNEYATIALIANDIIELALDTFIFESTYLKLGPYSKTNIPIYFTKIEHTGYHQSYYEFELIDPKTDKVMMSKRVKVFAEVLPNPIQIHPVLLDMSKSPVSHGYCEDHFVISNSHRLFPVTVKIKLTTKMKKMFYVEPMESVLPALSSVTFAVKFCSRDFLSVKPSEDLVHFTFKIIVIGYKAVYENVPPFFYEVVAPCAEEFKKVYNEKYFKEE